MIEWPAEHLPPGAFGDPKELVGRVLISRVLAQQPLLPGMLAAKNAGSGLAALIPPNMRAIAVRVDDVVGVAGFIHADDRVDVMVTLRPNHPGAEAIDQGVLAEHQGAGGRPGARDRRQGAHARDARHGRHAAGVARRTPSGWCSPRPRDGSCSRCGAGPTPCRSTPTAPALRVWSATGPPPAGPAAPVARRARPTPVGRAAGVAKNAEQPPPPTLTAEAPQKDIVEILRGDRFEERNFNRGDKR